MEHRILIMGPAGSGKTTLGQAAAQALGCPYFDLDDVIWRKDTAMPYTVMYSREEKISRLRVMLEGQHNFVLGGSMSSFHEEFDRLFTFAVCLTADPELRRKRVQTRAEARFGRRVLPGGELYESHRQFLDNADRYETDGSPNLREQEAWLHSLSCPRLRLAGGDSIEENCRRLVNAVRELEKGEAYCRLPLRALLKKLRNRELTCEQLCRYYLWRISLFGERSGLNCVSALCPDAAEQAAALDRGGRTDLPLYGLCVLVKDNIDVKGMITSAGSIALRTNLAAQDAPVVAMLREAGAVILGKTNLTEFANFLGNDMPGGFSSLGGQVLNAYDREKTPGGSSSGSAAAMSAGLCSFSVGTDTSFSVVGCASLNGVTGFKPPVGRLSGEGIVPISHYLDSVGFFTRTVADLKLVLSALMPEYTTGTAPKMALAVNDFRRDKVAAEQLKLYDGMLDRLQTAGYAVKHTVHAHTPVLKELMFCCFAGELEGYLAKTGSGITVKDVFRSYADDPEHLAPYGTFCLRESMRRAQSPENETHIAAIIEERDRLRGSMEQELRSVDACLMTGPTAVMHLLGLPSVSVPFADNGGSGVPANMILYGADGASLVALAAEIEARSPEITPPV